MPDHANPNPDEALNKERRDDIPGNSRQIHRNVFQLIAPETQKRSICYENDLGPV